MEKMKRFIDCYIPTETCNFRCHYCYIANWGKFNQKLFRLTHTPEEIGKALSKERLGGICLINLCAGGETLLSEEVVQLAKILLEEGHYVMIVTNGSLIKRFKELAQLPKELLKHLFFKFSFHYLELKRMGILNKYVENVNLMKNAGASFTIELMPTDELEPYIDEIKEFSLKKFGALPHVTIGRKDIDTIPPLTEHSFDEYLKIWSVFDSEMFRYKSQIFGIKREEFCYAGEWSAYLNIETGDLRQCYCGRTIDNIYNNLDKPINFCPIGNGCTMPHCYNGHAFLTLGDIPEHDSLSYDKLRDRKCSDGTAWLNDEMRLFMQCKLKDSNVEYSNKQKREINRKNNIVNIKNKISRKINNVIVKGNKNES